MPDTLLAWILGLIVTTGGACIGHLYIAMNRMQEKMEINTASQLREMRTEVNGLRADFDRERTAAVDNRIKVIEAMTGMVKQGELERQLDRQTNRLLTEIDRRIGWPKTQLPQSGHES